MVNEALADHEGEWSVVSDRDSGGGEMLTVTLGGSVGRHQDLSIVIDDGECVVTSVVLGKASVTRSNARWRQLARLAWQRNADQEIVTFGFDDRDRLIGQVRHPADHLDPEELEVYLHAVSRECDRFEYLLTGADVF